MESTTAATRTDRRKARTRAGLIAAARHLFAAQGFEATTTAEVAEEADVSIGSFYNYFRTKEDLLAALLEEALAEQLARLQSRQAEVTDPAEAVSVAHRHFVRLAQVEPEWAWLLVRLEVPFRVLNAVLGEAAMRDLEDGIEAGRFQVANRRVALRASGGALLGVMHAVLVGELGERADSEHAAGVLRSFGVPLRVAAEIAGRPLPEVAAVG